jgi:glycerol-1-phosphate dehydrogenase [NAD(P)+]
MPAGEPGDPIAQLLAGTYRDAETGEQLGAEARAVVIEPSLDGAEVALVSALAPGPRLAVISDTDTHAALGRRVDRALGSRFAVQSIVLPAGPRADAGTVAALDAALDPRTDAVVAVGAGTINDLAKMVAFARDRPQMVFATAPSMNGYTSVAASIITDGVKRSFRTRTPAGVFFDLKVVAAAPLRLIRAGLGDSACRPTAQTDWLLQHLLLERPYREVPFALLAEDERALFALAGALVAGDLEAMRHLVRTLVLSGFGMTICSGSFPASQGEHLLSHYLESKRPASLPGVLHGEQVGVCTVAMAALQDRVLARDRPPLVRPCAVARDEVVRRFGAAGEACWRELEHKRLDRARAEAINARLETRWDAIRTRLHAIRCDAATVRTVLAAAGAATVPGELGYSPGLFAEAMRHARELRDRYTFLDLACDAGLLA